MDYLILNLQANCLVFNQLKQFKEGAIFNFDLFYAQI